MLVHSPLVGRGTWQPVADDLAAAGYPVTVPDLAGAIAAGPLLATAGTMLGERARGYVFVDTRLPAPGHSWMDTVLPALAAKLRDLADPQGWLPPWPQWRGGEAELAALLPDPAVRLDFAAGCPPAADGHARGGVSARGRVAERSLWLSPAQRGVRRRRGPST